MQNFTRLKIDIPDAIPHTHEKTVTKKAGDNEPQNLLKVVSAEAIPPNQKDVTMEDDQNKAPGGPVNVSQDGSQGSAAATSSSTNK